MGKELGIRAENYLKSLLSSRGIDYEYVDDWYDLKVKTPHGDEFIEVKSCQISVLDGPAKYPRPGRFDFTEEDNRTKQRDSNTWVAFIVRHFSEFLLLGFVRARKLRDTRYIRRH